MKPPIKRLLFASFSVVLVVFLSTLLVMVIDSDHQASTWIISLFTAGVAAAIAALLVVFWAIPLHLVLVKFSYLNFIWYFLGAVIPSFAFIYGLKPFGDDSAKDLLLQASVCTIIGSMGAFVFWYIAVYKPLLAKDNS